MIFTLMIWKYVRTLSNRVKYKALIIILLKTYLIELTMTGLKKYNLRAQELSVQ